MYYFFMSQDVEKASENQLLLVVDETGDNRYMKAVGRKGLEENMTGVSNVKAQKKMIATEPLTQAEPNKWNRQYAKRKVQVTPASNGNIVKGRWKFEISIHWSAQSIAVTMNEVEDTFVDRAADMSVDQAISILANIYLLRSGDATDIRIAKLCFKIYRRIAARLTRR